MHKCQMKVERCGKESELCKEERGGMLDWQEM